MNDFRCKNGDLHIVNQSAFGSTWACRTPHPIEKCLHSMFFITQRHQLRAGDSIDIYRFENDTFQRVIEQIKSVTVRYCDSAGVELAPYFQVAKLDEPGEKDIVVARGFAGQFVIRVDGATHATRNTVVEAREYAEMLSQETGRPWEDLTVKKQKAA